MNSLVYIFQFKCLPFTLLNPSEHHVFLEKNDWPAELKCSHMEFEVAIIFDYSLK